MISRIDGLAGDDCSEDRLVLMLREELDSEEQAEVTRHLDSCDRCRGLLEDQAGNATWWDDARQMLAEQPHLESTVCDAYAPDGAKQGPGCAVDEGRDRSQASLAAKPSDQLQASEEPHWMLPLLDRSDDPRSIGEVDGMSVHKVVGQGGMGVVLQAWDPELQRFLAVKLLSPMLAHSGAARQRFLREAQAAAAVVHPNIVPIYAVSAERKLPHLVMPFVGGGNLQQLIDETGPLPVDRILSYALQVAEGLAAAHQQGIIHRDIKPANLMLDEGGFRVMLTDFGLARAFDDATLTGTGTVAGTPQYMSPEQAQGQAVDHRSDIYSLGAVMYTLATGRPPIRGASTLEVLRRITAENPRPISEINETCPIWFQGLVAKFMHRSLQQRIGNSEAAVRLLRDCLAHARAPVRNPLPVELKSGRRSRNRIFAVSALGVVAAMIVLAVGFLGRTSRFSNPEHSTETSHENSVSRDVDEQALVSGSPAAPSQPSVSLLKASPTELLPASDPQKGLPKWDQWDSHELEGNLFRMEQELRTLQKELEQPVPGISFSRQPMQSQSGLGQPDLEQPAQGPNELLNTAPAEFATQLILLPERKAAKSASEK